MGGVYRGCPLSLLLKCGCKVLAIFIDANMRIKSIQIGDHEIKILDVPDDNTILF